MNQAIKKAQQFVTLARNAGVLVVNASVFGSWAKGRGTADSDIDVCVVSPNFGKDYIEEMVELRKIALKVDSRIEPIPFTPQDLSDSYGTLATEIRKHSIALK